MIATAPTSTAAAASVTTAAPSGTTGQPATLATLDVVASMSPLASDLVAVSIVAAVVVGVLQTSRRWSRASAASAV